MAGIRTALPQRVFAVSDGFGNRLSDRNGGTIACVAVRIQALVLRIGMMNYRDFIDSLKQDSCPDGLSACLQVLWHDAKGDWNTAHQIVQRLNDAGSARIHAYLHRREGDEWNARYWHRRAGSVFRDDLSLEQEWRSLLQELLGPDA